MQETIAYILPLADISATLSQVGGKGASLARLVTRRHRCARARDPRRGRLWQCHDVPAHRQFGAGQRRTGYSRGAGGTGTDCDASEVPELTNVMQV